MTLPSALLTKQDKAYFENSVGNVTQRVGFDSDGSQIDDLGALVIIDLQHHEIHEGDHYFVKDYYESTATNFKVVFLTDVTKKPHARFRFEASAEYSVDLYESCTTSSNGTAVTFQNNDRNSTNTCSTKAWLQSGVSANGTKIWSTKIGSGKDAGGSSDIPFEIIGKLNTKYLFDVNKVTVGSQYMDYEFSLYEH